MSLSSADSLQLAVFTAISEVLDIPVSEITEESDFLTDFGANSLDIVNLIWHIEEKFSLPESSEDELEKLSTVKDLVDLVRRKADPDLISEALYSKKSFVIASDHAGVELKTSIIGFLKSKGYTISDLGPDAGQSVDYPHYAQKVAMGILEGEAEHGILICGTGIGMSIAANKIDGIRAALCSDPVSARFTRLHNDANVLCLGARIIGSELALACVDTFASTAFDPGDDQRHQRRINLLTEFESS